MKQAVRRYLVIIEAIAGFVLSPAAATYQLINETSILSLCHVPNGALISDTQKYTIDALVEDSADYWMLLTDDSCPNRIVRLHDPRDLLNSPLRGFLESFQRLKTADPSARIRMKLVGHFLFGGSVFVADRLISMHREDEKP